MSKQVGVFSHYLTTANGFQPGIERANKFVSQEMAQIMAKKYGGTVQPLNK
ncbi:MAG: hypothetical protein Cpurp_00375 [Chlorogloea purpurea SAG 13.99]|nr:hypothetical protein [Chlorogloea purpurea SAG 13.99]